MKGDKVSYWIRTAAKWLTIPTMIVIAVTEGAWYPLAGIMTVVLVTAAVIEYFDK